MAWNIAMAKKGGIGEDYGTGAVAGEFYCTAILYKHTFFGCHPEQPGWCHTRIIFVNNARLLPNEPEGLPLVQGGIAFIFALGVARNE